MKMNELLTHTFKALRRQLGHDRSRDQPPMWQRRLSADSDFCRALVSCGFLTGEQMQRAAERYRVTVEARQLLGHPVYLSPLLEQQATKEQKAAKIDIVDFCFSKTTGLFI